MNMRKALVKLHNIKTGILTEERQKLFSSMFKINIRFFIKVLFVKQNPPLLC